MNLNDLFTEEKVRLDPKCWTGKKIGNPKTKMKGGTRVNNCVPAESLNEFAPGAGSGGDAGNYFQTLASAWYNGTFDTGSLQKGIKSKEDIERLLQRGIVCPDGVTRKFGIDYNSDFDGVVISSDDYYEHADHDETDSRTGKPFGPYDYMEFGDDDLDESAKWRDPKYKGQLYTQKKPDYNDSREYDNARWYPKPKGYKGRKEPIAGGEFPRTDPLVKGFGRYGVGEPVSKGPRKGLPSRDQITSLKQSIKDISGKHTRANLPEMDKSQTPPGRDGSNDSDAGKKEYTAKPTTAKKVAKDGEKILNKELNKKQGVAEGDLDEGWKEKLGGAALAGTMALGAGGANARVTPDGQGGFTGGFKPSATVTAPADNKQAAEAPKGFSKEYLQSVIDGKHPRPMVSVEKAKELLKNMHEGDLNEKSTSQAQFRTMAAAAHNPEFAKKVGISRDVAQEFHGADRKQDYTDLPKKADESKSAPKEKEADYGDDYQAMVSRVKKLAGLGPLKTVYDPTKRVYRNVPTAVQPKK